MIIPHDGLMITRIAFVFVGDSNYISHDSLLELELSAVSVSRSRRWSEVHWWSASGFIIAHWARALTLISKGEFDVTAAPKKSIERESPTFPRLHYFSRGQVRIRMVIRVYIASSSGSVAVSNMFTSRVSELRVVKLETARNNFKQQFIFLFCVLLCYSNLFYILII